MPYISTAERLGIEKGLKEGLKEGVKKGVERVALRLLSEGEKPTYVKKITGLPINRIKALQAKKH